MKMISVRDYKYFNGRMLIQLAPRVKDVPPFIEGPCDWIFDPSKQIWINESYSYPEDVCTPIDNKE